MANRIISNGANAVECPSLGDIASYDRLKVTEYDVVWSQNTGYIWSQGSSTNRMGGAYRGGTSLSYIHQGQVNTLGVFETIFGSTTLTCASVVWDVDIVAGTLVIEVDGSPVTGSPFTISTGTATDDGGLFRLMGRGSSQGSGSGAAYIMAAGDKRGDCSVEIDSGAGLQPVRYYAIPSSGTTIPDTVNSADGTMLSPTGGGADFEILTPVTSITAPVMSPLNAMDLVTRVRDMTVKGTYSGEDVIALHWREMNGLTVINDWAPVTSFGLGLYEIDVQLAGSIGNHIEVRVTTLTGTETDTSVTYSTKICVMTTGSSSGDRMYLSDTGTVAAGLELSVLHRIEDLVEYTSADGPVQGANMVELANTLYALTGEQIGFLAFAFGGTRITNAWLPGDTTLETAVTRAGPVGASVVIDQSGYNDANNGVTVTEANVNDFYGRLREVFNCPIITGTAQRRSDGTNPTLFVELWRVFQTIDEQNSWLTTVHRHDLELEGTHIDPADEAKAAIRFATAIAYQMGDSTYWKGPTISTTTYKGQEVSINLNTAGTDYTAISPASGIDNFQFEDDSGIHTIASIVATSKARLTATLNRDVVGTLNMRFAGYNSNVPTTFENFNYPLADSAVTFPIDPLFYDVEVLESVLNPDELYGVSSVQQQVKQPVKFSVKQLVKFTVER